MRTAILATVLGAGLLLPSSPWAQTTAGSPSGSDAPSAQSAGSPGQSATSTSGAAPGSSPATTTGGSVVGAGSSATTHQHAPPGRPDQSGADKAGVGAAQPGSSPR